MFSFSISIQIDRRSHPCYTVFSGALIAILIHRVSPQNPNPHDGGVIFIYIMNFIGYALYGLYLLTFEEDIVWGCLSNLQIDFIWIWTLLMLKSVGCIY